MFPPDGNMDIVKKENEIRDIWYGECLTYRYKPFANLTKVIEKLLHAKTALESTGDISLH